MSQSSLPSKQKDSGKPIPQRQIRAVYDEDTITVYQAYSQTIAEAAVREQRLNASPEFRFDRMTWIKPSWCWMMYRSGYAAKDERQTHILALKLKHSTFLDLLSSAAVCNHGPFTSEQKSKPVRVQWDPERSPAIGVLPYRSLQVGIGRSVVQEWVEGGGVVAIEDVTGVARRLGERVRGGEGKLTVEILVEKGLLPVERVYEVPEEVRRVLGMDG